MTSSATARRWLSLDPGQVTGVAWSEDGTIHPDHSLTWDLEPFKKLGPRGVALLQSLKSLPMTPTHVIMENAFAASGAWQRWLYGYQAITAMWAEWIGAEFTLCDAPTLKKWSTGRGKANDEDLRCWGKEAEKERMRAAAIARWPEHAERLEKFDNNRIDALWVLAWAIETGS